MKIHEVYSLYGVGMQITVIWDVTSKNLVDLYQRVKGVSVFRL
jgi:hypothetical protein